MLRYLAQLDAEASEVIRDEARLFYTDAMRATDPQKKSKATKVVANDIKSTQFPLRPNQVRNPRLLQLVKKGDTAGAQAWFKGTGHYPKLQAREFSYRQHTKHKRNGSVWWGKKGKGAGVYLVNKGDQQSLQQYIKKTQAKVGMHKAAWGHMAHRLGGRVPGWVLSKWPKVHDLVHEEISLRGKRPYIKVDAPGLPDMRRQVPRMLNKRVQAINKKAWLLEQGKTTNTRFRTR